MRKAYITYSNVGIGSPDAADIIHESIRDGEHVHEPLESKEILLTDWLVL